MKETQGKNTNEAGYSLIELMIVAVILVIIIGIISAIIAGVNKSYSRMRPQIEAVNDTNAALDMMTRLIRMAGNNPQNIAGMQAIDPGVPTGGQFKTIRIRSDWRGNASFEPPDGAMDDPYEDIIFSVTGGKLMKKEPGDAVAVEYLDRIDAIRFNYFDTNNAPIADPVAQNDQIARVDIELDAPNNEGAVITFKSSAIIRRK